MNIESEYKKALAEREAIDAELKKLIFFKNIVVKRPYFWL